MRPLGISTIFQFKSLAQDRKTGTDLTMVWMRSSVLLLDGEPLTEVRCAISCLTKRWRPWSLSA